MTKMEFLKQLETLPPNADIIDCLYAIEDAFYEEEFREMMESAEIISDMYDNGYEVDDENRTLFVGEVPDYIPTDHLIFFADDREFIPN